MAESADAPDLESGEKSWGFKSLHPHHLKLSIQVDRFFYINTKELLMTLTLINQTDFKYTIEINDNVFSESTYSVDSIRMTTTLMINGYTFVNDGLVALSMFESFAETLSKAHTKMSGSTIFYNSYEDSNLSLTFSKDGTVRVILHHMLDDKTRIFRTDTSDQSYFTDVINT